MNVDNISLLIADAGGQIRTEIKNILHHEGYREMRDTSDVSVIREAVTNNEIDLLIADYNLPNSDVCQLVKDIRHNKIGSNPFIVIVMLALDPEKEDLMNMINSGSDDVILKPITAGGLSKRIRNLVSGRKQFVVTSEYIGPTRRSHDREDAEKIPEIDVPNPMNIKAAGGDAVEEMQKKIDEFTTVLNSHKMSRNSIQIEYLVDQLLALYDDGEAIEETTEELEQLQMACEDTSRRLIGTEHDHVGELCKTLLDVVKRMSKNWLTPDTKDLQLLPQLAKAIHQAFSSDGDDAELARSISESVQQRSG